MSLTPAPPLKAKLLVAFIIIFGVVVFGSILIDAGWTHIWIVKSRWSGTRGDAGTMSPILGSAGCGVVVGGPGHGPLPGVWPTVPAMRKAQTSSGRC